MSEIIKCLVSVEKVFFPRRCIEAGDWAAFTASLDEVYEGQPRLNNNSRLTVSGVVPGLEFHEKYVLIGKHKKHETYGDQYEILCMNKLVNLNDPVEQRVFLEHVLTDSQINRLYEELDNPFEVIKAGDVDTLKTVKGIGDDTAKKIILRYKDNINNGLAYVELDSYGLTKFMIDKLIDVYGSADTLIKKIKENPYILIEEVDGIGWTKADSMALNAGWETTSMKRINAYIIHHLKTIVDEGDTWTTPQELVEATFDALEIDDTDVFRRALYALQDRNVICWDDEKTKISLTEYYNLEKSIAAHLFRLMAAEDTFIIQDYEFRISQIEAMQDFDFTDEQLDAIKLVVNSPVSIITGFGGTGKSSVVSGVLKILRNYSFAQTALSGRAASRLSEITNAEGHTIHRLLGFDPVTRRFGHNEHFPLPYDIIILDEISMVGAELFNDLIQAIQTGSKLIMIGDDGQLESIGLCNIFKDMLDSGVIPVAKLTKIHRQAAKSAIITESVKVRNHEQLVPHKWVGEEIRGELQDLELNIYDDAILSQKRILEKFNELYERHPEIEDIQIVVPMRYRGEISTLAINNIVQDIVNPYGKNEIEITHVPKKGEKITYRLRESDKVIVTKNNYKTKSAGGEDCPIFNGNRGIVESINDYNNEMIINFEQWGNVLIQRKNWKDIELGYALTCHKLQGSEAKYVIIGLDYSCRTLLTKEWLYTAITRAKKHCVLCAETNALAFCITNSNVPYKRSFLKEMLQSVQGNRDIQEEGVQA